MDVQDVTDEMADAASATYYEIVVGQGVAVPTEYMLNLREVFREAVAAAMSVWEEDETEGATNGDRFDYGTAVFACGLFLAGVSVVRVLGR